MYFSLQFFLVEKRLTHAAGMMDKKKNRLKNGQVMLEYVIALGVFMALIGVSAALIYVFRMYGNRVLDIIAIS